VNGMLAENSPSRAHGPFALHGSWITIEGVSRAKVVSMQPQSESRIETNPKQAAEHLAGVQVLLKALQDKVGEHPLLAEAILKVEMALNTLGIKTGAML
jgi:hypothetical protein